MSIRKSRLSQVLAQPNEQTPSQEYLDLEPETTVAQPTHVIERTPEPTDTAAIAYQEIQNQQDEENESDLNDTVDGMHEVADAVQQANDEEEGLSAESAYMAGLAMESYAGRLGVEFDNFYDSLESIIADDNGRQMVSVEGLQISMEGPDSKGKDRLKRFVGLLSRSFKFSTTQVKVSATGLDKIIDQAKKVKSSGKRPTIVVKNKLIMKGDEPSKNVGGDFKQAAENLHYMSTGFVKQAKEDVKSNFSNYITMATEAENGATLDGLLSKLVSSWKDPRSKLKGNPAEPYIGNQVLFEDHEVDYKGSNKDALKLSRLANLNYPTHSGFQSRREYNKGESEIPALTPSEIVAIGKLLKETSKSNAVISGVGQYFSDSATVAAPFFFALGVLAIEINPVVSVVVAGPSLATLTAKINNRTKGEHDILSASLAADFGSRNKEVAAIKDALNTSGRLAIHTGIDSLSTLASITRHFKTIAKASLAAYTKASTESYDGDVVQVQDQGSGNIDYPNDNEPNQVPEKDDLAPVEEVVEYQETYQDQPAAHQGLNGPVWMNEHGQHTAEAPADERDAADAMVETPEPKTSAEDNTPEEDLKQPAEEADEKADAEDKVVKAVQGATADTKPESKDPALRHKHSEAYEFDSAAKADQKILEGEKIPEGIQPPKVQTYQGSAESLTPTTPYWFKA